MRNGLYSIHIHMLDGVRGRDSGILILKDGELLGGGPYFWSVGRYRVGPSADGKGTWKGELITNQHTEFEDPFVRPLFGGQEVSSGFSGKFDHDSSEVLATPRGGTRTPSFAAGWKGLGGFGTTLVGTRSLSFRAVMKRLADE